MVRIHPTAIVERHTELGVDVVIGPFCHVRAGARIGDRSELVSHVVIGGPARLGADNRIHPFAVSGSAPVLPGSFVHPANAGPTSHSYRSPNSRECFTGSCARTMPAVAARKTEPGNFTRRKDR